LLVAPPDPAGPAFPRDALGYGEPALAPLPFPSIVVASSDDPYGSLGFAERCARAWGSRLVEIGPRGHINADSGLGDWEEGQRLLASLAG
jgi:predicted alpha/beta hydrolase family esterase